MGDHSALSDISCCCVFLGGFCFVFTCVQLLDTAEKAISDAGTRARLLDEIKSSTLDFLLDYLPNIEVQCASIPPKRRWIFF